MTVGCDDDDANANDPLCDKEILNSNLFSTDSAAKTYAPVNNQQTSTAIHSIYNSWLFDDYNEESLHEEVWFDVSYFHTVKDAGPD